MPRVSIIIPCFNAGEFLDESVNSALAQTYKDIEIIIADDCSVTEHTKEKLKSYNNPLITVIHLPHRGLASTRNSGIKRAKGDLILPLDADDRIDPTYVEKAVAVMDSDSKIGIVYARISLFGEQNEEPEVEEYSLESLLLNNMIVCCSMFRKKDWAKVGGYNTNMTKGYEDWDLWISLAGLGRKVYRLPEALFFYRIRNGSMLASMTPTDIIDMRLRIMKNHKELYARHQDAWLKALLRAWLMVGEYSRVRQECIEMRQSFSWKVTEPLRMLRRILCRSRV